MDTPVEEKKPRSAGIEFYGGYQVYSESGIDLTLLRDNLKRSVTERLNNNRRALAFVQGFRPSVRARQEPATMLDEAAVIRSLVEHHVAFVVIGGLAMRAHGSAHITDDIDICYERTPANIAALVDAFATLHPYLRGAPPGLPFRLDVATIQAGLNFTLTTDVGPVDILGEVSGVGTYADALAHSVSTDMHGFVVRVLSLDSLIDSKRAAGRLKDRNHILELEELKKLRDANQPRS